MSNQRKIIGGHVPMASFPSKGKYNPEIDSLPIPLFTFLDLLDYLEYSAENHLDKLFRDIVFLGTHMDIDDILLFDFPALVFISKVQSIKNDPSLKVSIPCSECNTTITTNVILKDIDFKTGLNLPEKIELNGKSFKLKIPRMKDVGEIIKTIKSRGIHPHSEVFLLCCYLDFLKDPTEVYKSICSSTRESIVELLGLIDNLNPIVNRNVTCSSCGEEVVIKLSDLTTDLFRLFRLNY